MLDNILALHSGIWTANRLYQPKAHCRPSGHTVLDEKLDGGWPESGVVELQLPCFGIGELRLILPAVVTALKDSELTVFAAPPGELNPIALCQAGLDLEKVIILDASVSSSLWCVEQALKSGCCRSAVLWGEALSVTQARRLQLAATENDCLLFMITHQKSVQGLPVSCRLSAIPDEEGLNVTVIKRRGLPVQPFHVPLAPVFHPFSLAEQAEQHETITLSSLQLADTSNVVPLFR